MPKPEFERPSQALLTRFTTIVGDRNALTQTGDIAPYLTERRGLFVGRTPMVLRPGTVGEVSEVMKLANETCTAIVPQGGNTGLVGAQIPHECDTEIIVSLSRLNQIRQIDKNASTITVEAGVTLADVQTSADSVERLFPLSLGAEGTCQIGGNLSTNAGGVGVLAYGNMRDLVLGLEVVLADGRIWNGLRTLRKDNTGYDMRHLFIGAEGTLGIITAAVLRLFPKPASVSTVFAGLSSLNKVEEFFNFVYEAAGPSLTAFEIIPRIGIDFVLEHADGTRDPLDASRPWYVLLEVSNHCGDGDDARGQEILERAFEDAMIDDAVLAVSIDQAQAFWQLRERLSDVQRLEGGSIKNDTSVPVSRVVEFIERSDACVAQLVPGARPIPFGHFGDGNIHYNISQPVDADKQEFLDRWHEVTDAISEIALDLGGSISAEHGIGRLKREKLAAIKSGVEMDMMRAIKMALDPKGILNPGKVL